MHISYLTDCVPAYSKAVDSATNWETLLEAIGPYKLIANDAIECVLREAEEGKQSWLDFRCGLAKERKKHFAGEAWMERFADILLPATMFQVSSVAARFFVPWGAAYIRMKDAGKIVEIAGVANVVAQSAKEASRE